MVRRALVVATGVSADGRREILGMALCDAMKKDLEFSSLTTPRVLC